MWTARPRANMKTLNFHALTRYGCLAGIVVLLLRRVLFLELPGLLPTPHGWQPYSESVKWVGIAVDAVTVGALYLVLLSIPFCLLHSLRIRQDRALSWAFIIDLALSVALYGTAYLLLAPPQSVLGG